VPFYPAWERVKNLLWGLISGVVTAIGIGWMTEAPWLSQRIAQLSWLADWRLLP
jgi:hypothetical protein